jgi:hypothetical protein
VRSRAVWTAKPPNPRLPTHTAATPHCMCAPCQVFELLPGIESQEAWHEAALLCHCAHDRVVPLYGIALTVRGPRPLG